MSLSRITKGHDRTQYLLRLVFMDLSEMEMKLVYQTSPPWYDEHLGGHKSLSLFYRPVAGS